MKTYLFLLTISPVQSFIEQARKSQDLYAGSRVLSELTRAAVRCADKNMSVIFPSFDRNQTNVSLPNRFIAKIDLPSSLDDDNISKYLKGIAGNKDEGIEFEVRKEWKCIANEAIKKAPNGYNKEAFDQQIEQLLDIHWAFEEITDDYKTAYSNLEALVGSIKNVRTFEQYTYAGGIGEQGRKCSLDGERNALFFGKGTNRHYFGSGSKWNPEAIELKESSVTVGENEGLSAVSFVKRFYDKAATFPSTAEIALLSDIEKATKHEDIEIKNFALAYPKFFSNSDFDAQLYYEENLNKEYFNKQGLNKYIDKLQEITDTHKRFKHLIKTKYYALIIFDGDNMGKWLSGSKLKEGSNLEEFHSNFSNLLAEYADKAKGIVTEPKGKTIYAGGDDFLGLVNVHELFDIMKELRETFDTNINQNTDLQKAKKDGKNFTFSAGIIVAHYKMPLAEVLKQARITEKKAKNNGDRNAFAITAMKHSGEVQETVLKWGKDSTTDIWEALAYIIGELKNDTFSSKFITNLTTELYQLAGRDLGSLNPEFDKVVYAEFERLAKNAFNSFEGKSDKKTKKEQTELLVGKLKTIYQSRNSKREKEFAATENFIHALQIADFLTRKTTQDN